MSEATVLPQTYLEGFDVGDGQSYRLTGTVLGDVDVLAGGRLIHEGVINRTLVVRSNGEAEVWGAVGEILAEPASTVSMQGTGPPGWEELGTTWAECLVDIDDVVDSSAVGYVKAQGEDSTEDAFAAATAAISLDGPSDEAKLWALIGAAVFHEIPEMRLQKYGTRGLWSPDDCRKRLAWTTLGQYFDAPPPLFVKLLAETNRAGVTRAYDYGSAVVNLVDTVLAIGEPPSSDALDRVAQFRARLLQDIDDASAETGFTWPEAPAPPPRKPKPRVTAKKSTKPKKPRSAGKNPPKAPPRSRRAAKTSGPTLGPKDRKANPVDAATLELKSMIGMAGAKKDIGRLRTYVKVEKERERAGLPVGEINLHLVMTGGPGTGKTTVARLLGEIYKGYGLLGKSRVVELSRSKIVGQYQGHTGKAVEEIFADALGGVLFLDEAYALATGEHDAFGHEAVDTLTPLLENHRGEICVVMAGYPDEMKTFLKDVANPGLRSRFSRTVHFPDYTDAELLQILKLFCARNGYVLTTGAERACQPIFAAARKELGKGFDNARFVRDKVFQAAVVRHHDRVGSGTKPDKGRTRASRKELEELLKEDMPTDEWPSDKAKPRRRRTGSDGGSLTEVDSGGGSGATDQ